MMGSRFYMRGCDYMADFTLYQGDCLEKMKNIPDKSIDMVLCDLPYGVTQNKWDSVIPPKLLWAQYDRIVKADGAVCLFSQMPFTEFQVYMDMVQTLCQKFLERKKAAFKNHRTHMRIL